MENLPATTPQQQPAFPPSRALGAAVNQGAIAIEQERAIAEAQGQLILAKRFPRSMAAATAELLEACKSEDFAKTAFYAVPNRGSGPSIRFAEEVARCFGNFQFGHRELSRSDGKSEIEVFAWDMEKNNRSTRQITVNHVVDTKNGPKRLTDQADIDNKIANVASKQMRGRIMALVPKHMVAAGIAACKLTLAGNNDEPISARVQRMVATFSKYGVNAEMLAKYIGHTLDTATVDELADLIGVYNAIKEGAKPSDYFGQEEEKAEAKAAVNAAAAAAGKKTDPAAAPAAKPTPAAAKPKPAAKPAPQPPAEPDPEPAATQPEPPAADEPPPPEKPPAGPGSDDDILF